MLYRWLTPLFRAGLISILYGSLVALPAAWAEQSADSAKKEVVVAELAEDESVEDVEHSEPLQSSQSEAEESSAEQPEEKQEATSLDLLGSEVAPGTATRLSWSPA
ncbi:MAG: hypothetical protein ACQETT_12085, partial [Pseudomonadota bacterium]